MKQRTNVFAVPAVIAAVTVFGLIACLWGGPAWRWASWIALAAPLIVIAAMLGRSRR